MLAEPNCFKRYCIHLIGVKQTDGEIGERFVCSAFPRGIPEEIAYGDNKHLEPLEGQKNDIVYEKGREA